MRSAGWLLSALTLGVGVVLAQREVDRHSGAFRAQEEALYLWKGAQVRRLVPGFENVAADLYWLRTVQYFGGQRLFAKDKQFDLLEPLTEITTTLDPRFEIAYRYGAIFLSEPRPVGAGRPRHGVELLERGTRALPLSWRLRQDLGFFTHLFLGESARAARILKEARSLPGAPYWLEAMAAGILAEGGDRAAARAMWQQMHDQAEGDFIRANAKDHLQVLDARDGADRAQEAVSAFARRFGRRPRDLGELAGKGVLADAALRDPSGAPFEYDVSTGDVRVSSRSVLWRPE